MEFFLLYNETEQIPNHFSQTIALSGSYRNMWELLNPCSFLKKRLGGLDVSISPKSFDSPFTVF